METASRRSVRPTRPLAPHSPEGTPDMLLTRIITLALMTCALLPTTASAANPVTGAISSPQSRDGKPLMLSALPPDEQPETSPRKELPERLRRQEVSYETKEAAGTIIVDTPNTQLYYILGNGRAIRYGVRVGRDGFT